MKAIVISTQYNGTTLYVADFHQKADDSFLVTGTTKDPKEAHDFGDVTKAKAVMIRLYNPYNRNYKVEPVILEARKRILHTTDKLS